MPIYEYQARADAQSCAYCARGFERLQRLADPPLTVCPRCGGRVFGLRGSGTQRVARLARVLGPVPIHRLDSDAARTPAAAARILREFHERGGVLVATALPTMPRPWLRFSWRQDSFMVPPPVIKNRDG